MHVSTDADARNDRRRLYTHTISDDSISDIEDNYESEGGLQGDYSSLTTSFKAASFYGVILEINMQLTIM